MPTAVKPTLMNPAGLSPQAEVRLASSGGSDLPVPDLSDGAAVTAWRVAQHDAWGTDGVPGEATHIAHTIAGIECLITGPSGAPTVMYLHGGGFCLGSPGTARPITARLANKLRVVSVDYRLAPEHPFPAGLADAEAVYRVLAADAPVALAGDSAGGNIALGVAQRCADVPPYGIALFSPHLDFGVPSRAHDLFAAYVADSSIDDPFVSPLSTPDEGLGSLPSLLLQTTTSETLYPQVVDLAERSSAAGGSVVLQIWQGLWHGWHYHRELPEAWHAVDAARDWLADNVPKRNG